MSALWARLFVELSYPSKRGASTTHSDYGELDVYEVVIPLQTRSFYNTICMVPYTT